MRSTSPGFSQNDWFIKQKIAWKKQSDRTKLIVMCVEMMLIMVFCFLAALGIRMAGLRYSTSAPFWEHFFPIFLLAVLGLPSIHINFLNSDDDVSATQWLVEWFGGLSHELAGATVIAVIFVLLA